MFKFEASKTLFSALVMRYVSEKSTTKITESKGNKSIHKVDMSGSTGPGGGGGRGEVGKKKRGITIVWPLSFDLFGMGGSTRSQRPASRHSCTGL